METEIQYVVSQMPRNALSCRHLRCIQHSHIIIQMPPKETAFPFK